MIRQDRFLLGILIGIALLVIAAVTLALIRQGSVSYGPEGTPQGVFQNYVLAVSKGDYQRAFGYLGAPTQQPGAGTAVNIPDYNQFQNYFLGDTRSQIANSGIQINDSRVTGETAILSVTVVQTSGDPFRSTYRQNQQAQLVYTQGAWKITQAPYPFWSYDWARPQDKPLPPVPVSTPMILPTPTR